MSSNTLHVLVLPLRPGAFVQLSLSMYIENDTLLAVLKHALLHDCMWDSITFINLSHQFFLHKVLELLLEAALTPTRHVGALSVGPQSQLL